VKIELVDTKSGQTLAVISEKRPNQLAQGKRRKTISYNLVSHVGKSAYIRMRLFGNDATTSIGLQYYYRPKGSGAPKPGEEQEVMIDATPSGYTLEQNHLNPFGMASQSRSDYTDISYLLPEAGEVRLAVYDLIGERSAC